MQAAVLHGKEDVRVEAVPRRALLSGEVRVRIEAALTCGTDLKVFKRGYHARMIVPPAVFGHEFAGVVTETHPAARGWQLGERVVAANSAPCGACFYCGKGQENLCDDLLFLNGAYAEEIIIPPRLVEKNLLRLQPGTAFRDAALTEPLACVVQGLADLAPRAGERVLVIGSGPIGLMFTALAARSGCEVTVSGRGEARMAAALRLGAAGFLPPIESSLPDGRRFDAVFEAVGKPSTWEAAVQAVRKGGRVNFFGGCPSGTTVTLDTGLLHYSNLTLLASFHHTPRTIRAALEHIESGVISARDFVDGQCALTELPEVLKRMTLGNHAVKTFVNVHA